MLSLLLLSLVELSLENIPLWEEVPRTCLFSRIPTFGL
jgi:hypothetical protein